MEKRRGSGVSQNPDFFPRQPARVLVVDALPPWWSSSRRVLCEALENVLALATALEGPSRIPLLSVYAVSRQQECLLPFVPVQGNLVRLHSCVEELRSLPGEGCVRRAHTGAQLMGQAVMDSLQQYKQFQRHQATQSNCCVEVTVLTSQPGRSTLRELELRLRETDLVSLKRLMLVHILHSSADWCRGSPPAEASPTEVTQDQCMLGAEVELQQVDGSVFALENVLKSWLHEQGGDREHLHLLLPSMGDTPVCIKCDIQERLISPALIPLSANLGAKTESPRDFLLSKNSEPTQSPLPQRLKAIKVLRADGVCESLLYGLPLLVRPSCCWSLDWDDMESNHKLFHGLCHILRSRSLFLLLQSEPTHKTSPRAAGVFSHYMLQASPSLSLLLKPVVSRELLLPCSMLPSSQEPCPEATSIVQASLRQLDEESVFNPLLLNSNLYVQLRSHGLLSHGKYTYKTAAKTQSQPAEGSRSTGSRQRRQAGSKARATVAPLPPSSNPSSLSSSLGPPPVKVSRPALTFLSSSSWGDDRQAPTPFVRAPRSGAEEDCVDGQD